MTLILSGTNGLSDVDGSASTPAIRGTDTNTGIFFPAADTIAFAEGGVEAARFDSSGNLGIGTSSPGSKLDINRGSAGLIANFTDGVNTNFQIGTSSLVATIGPSAGSTAMAFKTADTERARIDTSGNLLVGTTSGSNRLTVNTTSQPAAIFCQNSRNVSGDFAFVTSLGSNCNNTSSYHIISATGGSDRFYVLGNGNVQNTNNSYGALSDAKLKENVTDATPKLENLNQVRIVNYNLIGEQQKQIGVIAQELEQVFPGMVEETPDRDEEGNDLGTTTKSVKYSVFVPMLIKALQELKAELDTAKARIAALEAA